MSRSSIRTPSLYPLLIGSAPVRSKMNARGHTWMFCFIAVFLCGLFFISTPAIAKKELLNQTVTVSDNGGASNLFVPEQVTLHLDYNIESGKEILLMIITEDQWNAISAGEKPSGEPVLRTTVSGNDTTSINLDRGTYTVFMSCSQGPAQVTLRAWAE